MIIGHFIKTGLLETRQSLLRLVVAMSLGLMAFFSASGVKAEDINSSHYAAFEVTVTLDGYPVVNTVYYYFVPKRTTLMLLHGGTASPSTVIPHSPAYSYLVSSYLPNSLIGVVRTGVNDPLNEAGLNAETITAHVGENAGQYLTVTKIVALDTVSLFGGDFNGDGQSDLVVVDGQKIKIITDGENGVSVYADVSLPAGAGIAKVHDTNGDGDADIALTTANGTAILSNEGEGQFYAKNNNTGFNTSLIGVVAGEFRVNEQGAATYSLPVMTFPGAAGIAPQIGLNYNSQGGWGIAGEGWSISGLSAISRCRQTVSQDDTAQPLTFTADDRFCLDGQRLVLTSGSTYGAPNSRYRTEIDSGVEVVALGGSMGHPDLFELTRKDGSTSYYGQTVNARQHAGNATMTWAISTFKDSAGNPIKFQYLNDTHQATVVEGFLISSIDYAFGANTSASTSATRIEFTYEPRPDVRKSYFNGTLLPQTRRLSKIESFNSGTATALRSYHVRYKSLLQTHGVTNGFVVADRSLLDAVYECVSGQCLKPTTFEWLAQSGNEIDWANPRSLELENSSRRSAYWRPLDFNGDGIMDLAAVVAKYTSSTYSSYITEIWVNVYQGALDSATGTITYSKNSVYYKSNSSGKWAGGNVFATQPMNIQTLDYNADGRQDIALWDYNSWKILLSRPTSSGGWQVGYGNNTTDLDTGISDENAVFADFNSDGLIDVGFGDHGYTYSSGLKIRYLTLTGNASSDRAYQFGQNFPLSVNYTAASPGALPLLSMSNNNGGLAELTFRNGFAGDYDGDGRMDPGIRNLFEAYANGPVIYFSMYLRSQLAFTLSENHVLEPFFYTGTTGVEEVISTSYVTNTYNCTHDIVGDINNDGLTDWLFVTTANNNSNYCAWQYVINGKQGGASKGNLFVTSSTSGPPQLVDYNRDGYLDIFWHDTNANQLKIRLWDPNAGQFVQTDSVFQAEGNDESAHMLLDINGDGALDHIRSHNSSVTIYPAKPLGPDTVISAINNGLGHHTVIEYERLNRSSQHYFSLDNRVQFENTTQTSQACSSAEGVAGPIYVPPYCYDVEITVTLTDKFYEALNSDWGFDLSSLYAEYSLTPQYLNKTAPVLEFAAPVNIVTRISSTAPTEGNTTDTDQSSIKYEYSEAKIQAAGRGLLGFRMISTIDEQSGVITTTRYRQDFPLIGSPLVTEVLAPAGVTGQYTVVKKSFNHYNFVSFDDTNAASPTQRYQVWAAKVFETTYDLNGDETSHVVITTNQPDAWGNIEHTVVSTYSAGNHVNFLTQIETTNSYNGGIDGVRYGRLSDSTVIHRRNDTSGLLELTKSSSFTYYTTSDAKHNLLWTETVNADPNDATTKAVTTTYEYDTFGNKSKAIVSSSGETSRETVWSYSTDGRYLNTTTNSLGHITESITQRNAYGAPVRIEGLNGYWVETDYDVLGREIYREDATGAWSSITRSTHNLIEGAVYKVITEVAGGGASTEYFDALGRSIAKSTPSFEGLTVWTNTEYDSSGRVKKVSEPYYEATGPQHWTENHYDTLGRVIKTDLPGVPLPDSPTISYAGLTTTYTNALHQTRMETRNATGDLVIVEDVEGGTIANTYTADGQLATASVTAEDGSGVERTITTVITYNSHGQKIKLLDPDKGTWFYEYNGFGELVNQYKVTSVVNYLGTLTQLKTTPGNYQRSQMVYDPLGRMVSRTDYKINNVVEGTATWLYDNLPSGTPAPNGKGRLIRETGGGLTKTYAYGAYTDTARTDSVTYSGGVAAVMMTTYDSIGRVAEQVDAVNSGIGTRNVYNSDGYLDQIIDLDENLAVYDIEATDVRGNVTEAILHDGSTVQHSYDPATGRLIDIRATTATGQVIQDHDYSWDAIGNMQSRADIRNAQSQRFCYDALNRLIKTHHSLSGSCSLTAAQQDQEYDGFGNITRKAGVGTYNYSTNMTVRPHAVVSAGGVTYTYDNNGNVVSDTSGRTFTYTTFDKPTRITKTASGSTYQIDFAYGADRARWRRIDSGGGQPTTTTYYLGNVEKVVQGSVVKYKRTIAGVAIWEYDGSGNLLKQQTLFKDALGSVVAVRNVANGVTELTAFDPWGQRVAANDLASVINAPPSLTPFLDLWNRPTTRGFTGHEMLDAVGVIHMNGRIYDPKLGRFLQADTFVDGVADTQGYNRYSYVKNNPISYTDPTGHFIPVVVGIVAAAVATPTVAAIIVGLTTIVNNVIMTGSFHGALKNGIVAGVSTYAFASIGVDLKNGSFSFLGIEGVPGAAFASGLTGGITNVLLGGKFGHGFVAAGIGTFLGASPLGGTGGSSWAIAGRTIAKMVIAGTVSKATGGKFANGAAFAAFAAVVGELSRNEVEEVNSKGATAKAIKASKRLGEQGNRNNLEAADKELSDYYEKNPADKPEKLNGALQVDYVHKVKDGYVAEQKVGLVKQEGVIKSTQSVGKTTFYMGSAPDQDTALYTILHEYGHHTEEALQFIRLHSRGGSNGIDPAETRSDNYADKIFEKIRGYKYESPY